MIPLDRVSAAQRMVEKSVGIWIIWSTSAKDMNGPVKSLWK